MHSWSQKFKSLPQTSGNEKDRSQEVVLRMGILNCLSISGIVSCQSFNV